ncbi:DHA2 family efflux MFS transporter permease subunit [Clostridium tagluense]|uniref:DHA2 family efflux MFS transporter permease subunit n=1 Tax=Clostridium tagluense TaxID=360422 RepID=UPI001C0C3862|nr:DHA2 family efflux MFS transporter permease subunit [Clostridium tagluense]MBU3130405.1 DHA2 family efflux MFS transporter permease subunit [Clostridium tagluense]MCB2298876.1 DHA2 family efflux MFS transporter permease subunit [Clostridium tagluense]
MKNTKKINSTSIIAVLVLSAFIATFNETILNVALSGIMKEMSVTVATVQWLITAYMIVTSVMVPITAFLIQTFKTRNLFFSALGLLLIGTVCAACSGSFVMLLISRMIQALGTGMMIPIMMNTVLLVSPKEKIGSSMAICVCAVTLGPAFGPTVSGIILQYFSWHILFIILIPIIVLVMIAGKFALANVGEITKPKIDYLSIVLSTIGLATIIYGISGINGSDIKVTLLSFIIGIMCMIIFIKRQISLEQPMLNLSPFKYPKFVIGSLLVMVAMMTIFTMNVMLPMFMEGSLGTTTFGAAISLLPAVLCNGIAAAIGGKIYDKYGVKWLVPVGVGIITIFIFILSFSSSETSLIKIIITYMFIGIGVGLTMSPSQTHALNQLPKEYYPHGVAIVNTLQQVSAAIGSSLFMGIMSSVQVKTLAVEHVTSEVAVATGFSSATMVAFGIVLIGLILSFAFGRSKRDVKSNKSTILE